MRARDITHRNADEDVYFPQAALYTRLRSETNVKQLVTYSLMAGMILAAAFGQGQGIDKKKLMKENAQSPGTETTTTVGGKQIWIYYHAPSMRSRKIFNGAGALQPDDSIWRLGADYATVLHTGANLDLNGLAVPAGDYSLYVSLDKGKWELIVNKKTGQWGINMDGSTTDAPADELGRTAMTMAKAPSPVETLKINLSHASGNRGKLAVEWENVAASVPFTVK
jgi:hypothetical protein